MNETQFPYQMNPNPTDQVSEKTDCGHDLTVDQIVCQLQESFGIFQARLRTRELCFEPALSLEPSAVEMESLAELQTVQELAGRLKTHPHRHALERRARRRAENRRFLARLKSHGCWLCLRRGLQHSLLHFHHLSDRNKRWVGRLHRYSNERMCNEILGTRLICQDCHTKHHKLLASAYAEIRAQAATEMSAPCRWDGAVEDCSTGCG